MVRIAFAVYILLGCRITCGQQGGYESFEDRVPAYVTAVRPASLGTSPWHSKHGKSSLRWEWSKGEAMVVRHGIGDVSRTGGFLCKASFVVWMYVEKPMAGAVVFEFRQGEKVTGSFRFPMRHTGWRQARVFYDEFPDGKPTSSVDNIRVCAPTDVAKGVIYLDSIGYNALTYYSASVLPEKVAQRRRPVPDERRFPKPARVTEAERAGIRKLGGALPEKVPGVPETRVQDLCAKVNALGIVRDEHGVRGPGLDARTYYCSAVGEFGGKDVRHWPDELGPNGPILANPGPMIALAAEVGRAWRASNDAQQHRRLADAFLLIADHLQDQGQALDSNGVAAMREVLAKAGRLEHHLDSVLYSQGADEYFVEGDAPVRSNMDFYDYTVARLRGLCLLQVEEAEQVRWLNAWKAMLERSMLQPSSAFKIDGSAYHHGGHYHSYAQGAFGNYPLVLKVVHQAIIMPEGKTIRGKKSWFFSDNRILCLGSGISCDEARHPTQTTLCQKSLRNNEQREIRPTPVDGADLTAFPDQRTLDQARAHWFLDVQQTGYYLPAGQKVAIAREHQTSRDVNDLEDTEGDFLTAWIDHGKAPKDASYEYMLVVRATPEAMRKVVAAPPYQVLQGFEILR
jgi:hypothetical protein